MAIIEFEVEANMYKYIYFFSLLKISITVCNIC